MKTFVLNEREVEIIQLALKFFIEQTGKNNDANKILVDVLSKRLQEYSEELFASVHSQGG